MTEFSPQLIAQAKALYLASTNNDPIVHCNRFPAWEELSRDQQSPWISKAQLNNPAITRATSIAG